MWFPIHHSRTPNVLKRIAFDGAVAVTTDFIPQKGGGGLSPGYRDLFVTNAGFLFLSLLLLG